MTGQDVLNRIKRELEADIAFYERQIERSLDSIDFEYPHRMKSIADNIVEMAHRIDIAMTALAIAKVYLDENATIEKMTIYVAWNLASEEDPKERLATALLLEKLSDAYED